MSFGTTPFARHPFAAFGSAVSESDATPVAAKIANAPAIISGDTALDDDGNFVEAVDPIDEEVAFYLTTTTGSFFGDSTIGNGVVTVRVYTAASIVAIRNFAERALRPMVERGDISELDVTPAPAVRNGTALGLYTVTYKKTNLVVRR